MATFGRPSNQEALNRRLNLLLGGGPIQLGSGQAGDRVRTRENLTVAPTSGSGASGIGALLMALLGIAGGHRGGNPNYTKADRDLDYRRAAQDFVTLTGSAGFGGSTSGSQSLASFAERSRQLKKAYIDAGGDKNPYLRQVARPAFRQLF